MYKKTKYSFVIPAYNEESNIPLIYNEIINLEILQNQDIEIIFINDGSIDNTLKVLNEISENDKKVKYINLSRNFGHQAALSAGLKLASGDVVISMDCDLQDPPYIIPEMIEKWKEGNDIVYARRLNFRKDNFFKKNGSKIFYKTMGKYSQIDIPQNVGDFRLITKDVLVQLNNMPEHARYIRGMIAWTGFKYDFVDYQRPDRTKGTSGYSFSKLATLGMDGMFNFSTIPLRLGFIFGIISIVSGILLLLYQLFDFLINGAYYHLYKWLIVVVFMFMGFMFILMWIIGEYIGRIFNEVRNRPLYIIKDKKNFD